MAFSAIPYIDKIKDVWVNMDEYGDPRTKDWPLMGSPLPTLGICLFYVFLVKVAGPWYMENRKPFQLKNTLIVYNALQVAFSAWLFYEIGISGWFTGRYNFRCEPVDHSNSPITLRMVHACWWYYFSKFTEFFDTFFFVLRKKTSQVSTLHVIHHGCMPMSVWFGVKFTPGGHSTFFGLLNTFVHIVMYSYYFLAALGPHVQKYLWWKKYLTALQMIQFIAIMVHAFQLLFIDCNYPKAFVWWIGMHAVMFFFLFNEFYKETYKKRLAHQKLLKDKHDARIAEENNARLLANGIHKNSCFPDQNVQHNGDAQRTNGHANGKVDRAADYYVKGDVPAELTRRKVVQ